MPRIILFTGKGGVGKTTLSAATAVHLAELGRRVLVISVDPAHSLSDVLELEVGAEPKEIRDNLFAQEVDVYFSVEKFWGKLKTYLRDLLRWQGVDNFLAEELAILPGMEEVCCFLWINKHFKEKNYDVIVVDSAPTGETLRFLSLPDAASWWVTKILPLQRKVMKYVRPAAKMITDMPLPEEETYDALEELFKEVYTLYYTLQDPAITSIRLVTNPEKMVLKETEKAFTYLHLFGFNIDAIFVNRVVEEGDPLFPLQSKYLERIKEAFEPTPIFLVPHWKEEVLGLEKLAHLGRLLYHHRAPDEVLYWDKPFEIGEVNGRFSLKIYVKDLPQAEPEIYHREEDLIIKIKNFKRHFYLPKSLAKREIEKAILHRDLLEIVFK
ncbi:MAG: TRC40/GET3/ArsA family transport-energizing ATPase [Caldimicrobium sp.]|nr:TRC40/GET3/ArsA family transport-energizing ATPase [Caldimicrobium sp.]MCX7873925.1 TRC40/GET3/ArsA family transport-energizing ATPase [Caldimicrobium sp.]MDW8094282.1 TRC40/GET3/ArsA family transport-energizing ATPase [Caldimicrobium sp.]